MFTNELLAATLLGVCLGALLVGGAFLMVLIFKRDTVVDNCAHDWVMLDKINVQDPGKPSLAIIYVHRCNKCGTVTRDRISNKG